MLIGDRYTHDYDTINSTHEWGFGVEIQGSNNVDIYNLEIQSLTGDGIVLSSYNDGNGRIFPNNIKIAENNIYNCRRQGISITCCKNLEIYNNEIHDINGTAPSTAIDLEPDNEFLLVENVKIFNNKLYNENNKTTIKIMKYIKNIEIYENDINGNIGINSEREKMIIKDNIINNGTIEFSVSNSQISDIRYINKIEFINNQINNCRISILNAKDILIKENKLNNTKIDITSSNVAIVDNVFNNFETYTYLYKYTVDVSNTNTYNLYLWNNNVDNKEDIANSEYLIVHRDYESVQQYIKDNFGELY